MKRQQLQVQQLCTPVVVVVQVELAMVTVRPTSLLTVVLVEQVVAELEQMNLPQLMQLQVLMVLVAEAEVAIGLMEQYPEWVATAERAS